MKAKSHFSQLVIDSVARGALGMFVGISVFIAGFVTWSAAGLISALIQSA